MKFNFIKPTLIFTLVGFFIPGFTVIMLLGIQLFLSSMGVDCSLAWQVINVSSAIAAFVLPALFLWHVINLSEKKIKRLSTTLTIFNLLEYTVIQASLGSLYTTPEMLCYGTDGQNGLELIFTGWLALPILFILSLIFHYRQKTTQ